MNQYIQMLKFATSQSDTSTLNWSAKLICQTFFFSVKSTTTNPEHLRPLQIEPATSLGRRNGPMTTEMAGTRQTSSAVRVKTWFFFVNTKLLHFSSWYMLLTLHTWYILINCYFGLFWWNLWFILIDCHFVSPDILKLSVCFERLRATILSATGPARPGRSWRWTAWRRCWTSHDSNEQSHW